VLHLKYLKYGNQLAAGSLCLTTRFAARGLIQAVRTLVLAWSGRTYRATAAHGTATRTALEQPFNRFPNHSWQFYSRLPCSARPLVIPGALIPGELVEPAADLGHEAKERLQEVFP